MERLFTFILIFFSLPLLADEGVSYRTSRKEYRIENYRYHNDTFANVGLFSLKYRTTQVHGLDIGVGYRLVNRSYIDLPIVGYMNGGITDTPRTYKKCERSLRAKQKDTETSTKDRVTEIKNKIEEEINKAKEKYDEESSLLDTGCTEANEAIEPLGRYGALMFYDIGLAPSLKVWVFRAGVFTGYRFEHKKHLGNDGDVRLEGFITKVTIGLEW